MPAPPTSIYAGNRRKEQNMTKQTVGFNWGAAATGCSVWTGVPLRNILLQAGLKDKKDGARFVCFEGADKLPNGYYGTSIGIDLAMDPTADVIIAFEQNGEKLIPDHGYPVRVIIPGWIGGRMVKWLTKIIITDKESDNYYHFFDNRILPPQVDKEIADKDGWWYKPEYLFNELNINSAIASPAHGEVVKLLGKRTYPMRGYAYTGGGHMVTRVEVSFDQGKTWELCTLKHLPPNHAGKHWCWCHWSYEAPMKYMLAAANSHIRVRAWDQSSNTQPFELTWNVMGMGNNPHFKVNMLHTSTKVQILTNFCVQPYKY
jgi:nitrate reductase (NAD(P)H)